ncbi:MAG: L,D-transpeptidase family protein [Gammaproteobacteria bacterium]|nr:L,D-transpeptidase family protein [Gammaproteobacteria bacterium]
MRLYCLAWILLPLLLLGARAAEAASYIIEDEHQSVVGEVQVVHSRWEETLLDIARRHGVGFEEIKRANPGVNEWVPGEGTEVLVPTRFVLPDVPRRGIVINLPEYRLYYFPETPPGEPRRVITHPVSIGRMDWDTPIGLHRITEMRRNPSWRPPDSVRAEYAAEGRRLPAVVPPGPDNPMGSRAMRLTLPSYLIHGTNRPEGVGMRVTAGCIRMYPEDVEALYELVSVGTEVRIINQPYKVGWNGHVMYLEAHPPLEEFAEEFAERSLTVLTEMVVAGTRERAAAVDWAGAEFIAGQARGVPAVMASLDQRSLPQADDEADTDEGLQELAMVIED